MIRGHDPLAWPQGLSDGSGGSCVWQGAEDKGMGDDDEPRHEEGIDSRWFVRAENGKSPIHLGDDYRRQKWPSDDDDLTKPP